MCLKHFLTGISSEVKNLFPSALDICTSQVNCLSNECLLYCYLFLITIRKRLYKNFGLGACMRLCFCVCVCVCIFLYMNKYIHVCIYLPIYVNTYIEIYRYGEFFIWILRFPTYIVLFLWLYILGCTFCFLLTPHCHLNVRVTENSVLEISFLF